MMDQKRMFKQMIDFQKTTFDNSFSAMTALQEQGEKMVNTFIEQSPWLPPEGKKVVGEWINAYKSGRENYKKTVDTNFVKVEKYFSDFESKSSDSE